MNISIDLAIKRIKIYAFAVAGMNRSQLARAAKLTESATRDIHKDSWNPELSTLRALESVIPADWGFSEMPGSFNQPTQGNTNDREERHARTAESGKGKLDIAGCEHADR